MTNELPRIEDASGALSSRFIVLTLTQSFYGREDHSLLDRFIPELPGILLWALNGSDITTALKAAPSIEFTCRKFTFLQDARLRFVEA